MSDCLHKELTRWDPNKPAASIKRQVTIGLLMWLWLQVSPLVTLTACDVFPKFGREFDKEANREWKRMLKWNVSPNHAIAGSLFRKSLYSSISEELLFRVITMKVLVKKFEIRAMTANFIQAVAFGALHLTNTIKRMQGWSISVCQSCIASISFFLYGWSFISTNSIYPAVIVHFLGNLQFSLGDSLGYKEFYNYEK